ncbi:hypothetical protein ZIOFF_039412 [Zingiber officinale]|uniref:Uncharacterized protein n=1 Tax=Zingiber officinale TaxID=94328 RepID=A0A8J5GFX4_ZINOF|nr:hypothetical protein ZIOFF_039412 [Zingiber officinale]
MKETSSSATDPRQPSAAKPYVPPTLSPQDLPIDYAGFLAVIFGVLGVTLRIPPGRLDQNAIHDCYHANNTFNLLGVTKQLDVLKLMLPRKRCITFLHAAARSEAEEFIISTIASCDVVGSVLVGSQCVGPMPETLIVYKLCSWLAIIFCAQSFANMKSFENDSKQLSMAFMFGVMGLVTNYLGPRPVKKS